MSTSKLTFNKLYRNKAAGLEPLPKFDAFQLISTQVLGLGNTSISFSSIPNNFRHLQVRWVARTTLATPSTGFKCRINFDTGANYAFHGLNGGVGAAGSTATSNTTSMELGLIPGLDAPSGAFVGGILDIFDYSKTKNKTLRALVSNTSGNTSGQGVSLRSGLWTSTASIDSLTFFDSTTSPLVAGSRFSIYGWN